MLVSLSPSVSVHQPVLPLPSKWPLSDCLYMAYCVNFFLIFPVGLFEVFSYVIGYTLFFISQLQLTILATLKYTVPLEIYCPEAIEMF